MGCEVSIKFMDIDEDDWSDKEGDDLGEDEASNDGDPEGRAGFGDASAYAESNRDGAHHGGDGSHDNRSKSEGTGFEDSFFGGEVFIFHDFKGKVNDKDSIFHNDTKKH